MSAGRLERHIELLSTLAEPVRRDLYLHVVSRPEPVGRDAAADAVGIKRALAAWHLDKLVEAGFLEIEFRRLSGRTGPGAGRPSKLYKSSGRQLEASVPQREYELAAGLLAAALSDGGRDPRATLRRVARDHGASLGKECVERAGAHAGRRRRMEQAEDMLGDHGYQPFEDSSRDLRLRNCPFQSIAQEHSDLVCGMNLELMKGLAEGLGIAGLEARLDPRPGMCCVVLRRAGERCVT